MIVKTIAIIALFAIIGSLASGMFFLVKDKGQSERTAKALTLRIGLSVALFAFLMLAVALGWIQPHGLIPPPPATVVQ